MADEKLLYKKQIGAAEAGGQLYEVRLAMLFLLRGKVAFRKGQINSFLLATNLDVAHPFDDIMFLYTRKAPSSSSQGSTELILLQAKHKKDVKKNNIVWSTLMNSDNRDFSLKKYLEGSMEMCLTNDDALSGPFARKEFVLYTNAPFVKSKNYKEYISEQDEMNGFYKVEGKHVKKISFNDSVYNCLKLNSALVEELIISSKKGQFQTERKIYQKYYDRLQDFVVGFDMSSVGVFQKLFNVKFLNGQVPEDIQELRKAYLKKAKNATESEEEFMTRLMETKVQINGTSPASENARQRPALVYRTEDEVKDFLESFYFACDQPQEKELEDIIKKEIASFYKLSLNDVDKIFDEVFRKILNWWKDEAYYLTQHNDWFETAKRNLSEPSLIYAVDLMKTKIKNTSIVYQSLEDLEELFESNKIICVECSESTNILNFAKIYQMIEKCCSNDFYILLDYPKFVEMNDKVLRLFNDDCNTVAVSSYERIPADLLDIAKSKECKRIIWVGSGQSEATSIKLRVGFGDLTRSAQSEILKLSQISLQGQEVDLTDLIKGSNLDDVITNDILADLVKDEITEIGRPLEGLGEVDPFHISRILKRKGNSKAYKPEEIAPDPGNMFVLISAPAGMGKSTLISNMRREAFYWKYRINLREHCTILNNRNNSEALDFLKEAIRMSETEYSFFKVAYELRGSIVLFFDGFDEIAPEYKRIVLELFMSLKTSEVSEVWVTTRPGFEEELEKTLDTIAYQLEPFSLDDQKMYLKKIWNTSDESEVDDHLNQFSKSIRDSVNFTGIPLHLKMISELSNESIFNEDLNLYSIYDQFFFKMIYQVLMRDKARMDLNNPLVKETVDERYVIIKSKHQMMAMLALFEKSDISNIISINEIKEFESLIIPQISQGKEKTGIVETIIYGRPVFTHRTFAEFFAASWLVTYYIKYKNNTKDFSKIKIYKNIYNPENNVLRLFFDFALCNDSEACRAVLTRDLDKLNNMTLKSLNKKDLAGRTAFHLANVYEYDDVYQVLTDKLANYFLVDQLFKFTPTQYLYFKRFSVVNNLQVYLKYKRNNKDEVKGEKEKNILHWAAANGNIDVVNDLIECGADVNATDKDLLTPLHLAAANGHIEVMKQLIISGAKLNEKDVTGMTPLLVATVFEKGGAIKILIENYANLDIEENDGFTPLHRAAINGNNDITKLLLENGAKTNVITSKGWTPLYLAAQTGHGDIVQTLIEQGVDPNSPDTQNGHSEVKKILIQFDDTPLHISAQNGYVDVAKILLENGAKIQVNDEQGLTPLHRAAEFGHNDVVQYLIDQGADVNREYMKVWGALYFAVRNNHLEVAQTLIKHGAEVNAATHEGFGPVMFAATCGHKNIMEYLIDQGADVNKVDEDGFSALHMAALNNQLEVAQTLIKHGAEVNAITKDDCSPLLIASLKPHKDMIQYLIYQGADVNKVNKKGCSALYLAVQYNHLEVVQTLINHGAEVNAVTKYGSSPLCVASLEPHKDMIQYLIDQGADVNKVNEDGFSALHLAISSNNLEVVQTLINHGAEVNAVTKHGYTPLYIASLKPHKDIIKYLIDQGADVNIENEDGFSALHLATCCNHLEIVQLLINHGTEVSATAKIAYKALCIAAMKGYNDIVEYLIGQGADLNASEKSDCIFFAAQHGCHEVIRTLIKSGVDVNSKTTSLNTPLHVSAEVGHFNAMQVLLDNGAEIQVINKDEFTPLHLAAQNGHKSIVQYLIDRGADLNKGIKDGRSALHLAAQSGHKDVVKYLIDQEVDINKKDLDDLTPLDLATQYHHLEVVQTLKDHGAN